ncbi:MAG: DoxX family membrane protein [Chloroflexota bacterium]|nr:DoxX family membrane protein [Chloroflexota bacterium]
MTTRRTTDAPAPPVIDPILIAKGMAVIRIFFGIILLANGLAKVEPALGRIDLGPYHANLVTREGARGILNFEINERRIREGAPQGTQVPGLKAFVNTVVLANWGVFQWVVVLVEVGAGLLLVLGLATRGAALVGLGQQLFLALVYASSNRWMFEQPHEYVPLIVLAIVPAGRMWGLDAHLVRDTPAFRRWPF